MCSLRLSCVCVWLAASGWWLASCRHQHCVYNPYTALPDTEAFEGSSTSEGGGFSGWGRLCRCLLRLRKVCRELYVKQLCLCVCTRVTTRHCDCVLQPLAWGLPCGAVVAACCMRALRAAPCVRAVLRRGCVHVLNASTKKQICCLSVMYQLHLKSTGLQPLLLRELEARPPMSCPNTVLCVCMGSTLLCVHTCLCLQNTTECPWGCDAYHP